MGTVPGHATVAATLQVVLDRLKAAPEAVDLLCLAVHLAPQRIPRSALEGHLDALPEPLARPESLGRAIGQLRRFSLVAADAEWLSFHRLV